MQTIILCGGLGTRLKSLYPELPKALVPIAGKPFIEWQIEWLSSQGIKKIHLAAGYKASLLREWLETKGKTIFKKLNITLSEEPEPLGTGGGLFYAAKAINTKTALVLNGDTLLPLLNLNEFLKNANNSDFEILIAIVNVKDSSRFGTITFDDKHFLISFNEKSQSGSGWINAGIYLFKHLTFTFNQLPRVFSIEKDFFPKLIKERKIGIFPVKGELFDMGTPDGIREMEKFFQR